MSSLINKVKDKLHSDNKTEQPEGTHGPHSSRTANAADPRIDSDRDHRENLGRHDGSYTAGGDNYSYGGDTTTSGMTGTGGTFDSSKSTGFGSTAATGPASKTAGMHSSNIANKADPRVDSDLDASRNMGLRSGGATAGTGTDTYGSTNTQSETTGFGTGPASKTAGTHSSNLANKADPRVDSDLDGSRNMGLRSSDATYDTNTGNTGNTGSSGTAMGSGMGSGMGTDTLTGSGATGAYGSTGTDTLGSSGTGAYGSTGTDTYGSTGTHGSSGLGRTSEFSSGPGHHNKDTTSSAFGAGTGSVGGSFGTAHTGPAPNTAGPHKSDMMNKADPRVDSDLDNSKTVMGDKTFSQS
ncbi:hypothetical protein V8C34DRAFT_268149 [Trichoderma compactum]